MEDFRVIIAGGRDFYNYFLVKTKCDYYLQHKLRTHRVIIVSGHAPGTDKLAEQYAAQLGLPCEIYPAQWERYGEASGPIRNRQMVQVSDALIAFWDGKSKGTKSVIDMARRQGLQLAVVRLDLMFSGKKA